MKEVASARWYGPAIFAVLAAQLCAALADNALLIVAITLLAARHAPDWVTPALRIGFYASYVLLAPIAGRWADVWPKGRLMTAVNLIKLLGVAALAWGAHPLLVFAVIGCGAAAYAPARYGMLPELTAGRDLLRANAAMEIVTIAGIICGYALGSALVARGTLFACSLLAGLYALGAMATPTLGVNGIHAGKRLGFHAAARVLLRDSAARYALILTSIFWSAAAVLQFLMISWARSSLGLSLTQAALMPALLALGIVAGALLAGAWRIEAMAISSGCAIVLGGAITLMPLAHSVPAACALLALAGLLAGILLVPMNALLQQRGASLMLPGLSVAVQNGLENGLSIIFLVLYSTALAAGASINRAVVGLGIGVVVLVGLTSWAMRHSFSPHLKEHRCSN
ncbi:MAG: lysophospholipid transporter LplT [Pseudomonadota bacterium]|nr:lysophospholipid transporter LplT [Pseudomonadota bacterium]